MEREWYFLWMTLTAGVVTIALRAFPFAAFGSGRKSPEIIKFIGKVLSPGAIAMLVVYCLASSCPAPQMSWGKCGLPEAAASVTVVLLQIWKRNPLVSIIAGTAIYMVLVQNLG